MNTKMILVLSLLLSIVAAGIAAFLFWQPPKPQVQTQAENQTNASTGLENIVLLAQVKGCAETENGTAAKSIMGKEKPAEITVEGNDIIYSRALNHLCCRKAVVQKEIKGNTINVYEVWSGIGCKCICFSEIGATLKNVPAGDYTVNVYKKGTKPGTENEQMEPELIISENVTIE